MGVPFAHSEGNGLFVTPANREGYIITAIDVSACMSVRKTRMIEFWLNFAGQVG